MHTNPGILSAVPKKDGMENCTLHKKYPRTDAAIGCGGCSSAGKFAASQTVKVQHSFQCGNVGVHVQRIGLE